MTTAFSALATPMTEFEPAQAFDALSPLAEENRSEETSGPPAVEVANPADEPPAEVSPGENAPEDASDDDLSDARSIEEPSAVPGAQPVPAPKPIAPGLRIGLQPGLRPGV